MRSRGEVRVGYVIDFRGSWVIVTCLHGEDDERDVTARGETRMALVPYDRSAVAFCVDTLILYRAVAQTVDHTVASCALHVCSFGMTQT